MKLKSPRVKLKEKEAGLATVLAFPEPKPRRFRRTALSVETAEVLDLAEFRRQRRRKVEPSTTTFGYFPGYGYYYAYWMWVPAWKIS